MWPSLLNNQITYPVGKVSNWTKVIVTVDFRLAKKVFKRSFWGDLGEQTKKTLCERGKGMDVFWSYVAVIVNYKDAMHLN